MSSYIRSRLAGGTFFFTLVTAGRNTFLCTESAREILRETISKCQARWPMIIDAFVLLPDHLHSIWTLPKGDSEYSRRWGWIKKEFTKRWIKVSQERYRVTEGQSRERRRGVWQSRFWEHTIRDERDFERYFHYIHYNPVKHGLVRCPHEWPWSSFNRWVEEGAYTRQWACSCRDEVPPMMFQDIERSVGE
jgi:putative transposase